MTRIIRIAVVTFVFASASLPSAHAIHFYRGTGSGCSVADGAITDDAPETQSAVGATVVVGHNGYETGVSGLSASGFVAPPETHVKVGQSVRWTWNSSHCHSVTSSTIPAGAGSFDSGFHYPKVAPESPQVAPGAFEYPVLDDTPTLEYTHTFTTPGTYRYSCVHHSSIGMVGFVLVDAA